MLRSLNRLSIKQTNSNNVKRLFHDCPVNALQPLRLLLIGCPVSLFEGDIYQANV